MAQLPNGKLLLAACRDNCEKERARRGFLITVHESADQGLTCKEIGQTPLFAREPSLTALPDSALVLSAQDFGPGATRVNIAISRWTDGGETWDRDQPVQLALSAKNEVGWPVTLQLADGSLLTAHALTAYLEQPPDLFVTEVVRWRLP